MKSKLSHLHKKEKVVFSNTECFGIGVMLPRKKVGVSLFHWSLTTDLRNISCTPLLSKIFEGYMLGKLKEETAIKANQYGGVKGCSTTISYGGGATPGNV